MARPEDLSLEEAGEAIRKRELSPVELLDAVLERIEAQNGRLNAFTTLAAPDQLRAAAKTAETDIAAGRWRGPLHGVPVSVKDLIDTAGIRTTYGSGMFRDHVPTKDGAVPERLAAAGALMIGKTATHEFGKGITTNNYFFGTTRNPWNPEHVPGGSSGGAGAACAAGLGPFHVGTDSGGSIRFPATWCGVVGLKPTHGLVSNRGQFGGGDSSLGSPGPIARSVRDAAIAMQCLAGFDPAYAYSRPGPVPDFLRDLESGVAGVRVGTSPDLLEPAPDAAVRAAFDATLERLAALGTTNRELPFPHHGLVTRGILHLFGTEGDLAIEALCGDRPRIWSPEVEAIRSLTPPTDAAACVRAQLDRQRIVRDWAAAFSEVDVVVLPGAPLAAPRIDEPPGYAGRCLPYTGAANLAGLPALALPAGFDKGMPLGVQIVGAPGSDALVLRVGRALEAADAAHRVARPPL